jgi:hypothetical protein
LPVTDLFFRSLCWLLSQSTHKKRGLGTMKPSIDGRMAQVASTAIRER